jgi:hypothetical protein
MVVCDVCGKSAAETVRVTAKDKSYRKDLCGEHLADLLKGARAPKRGRPTRSKPTTTQPTSAPRRRGRTPKAAAETAPAPIAAPKRERKKITDAAILEKRRAALVKARQARAAKRALSASAG